MNIEFVNLTAENIDNEHLCCIIRTKKPHAGVEAKRSWLKERLAEGHVFRKANVKGCAFIEYAPLESAFTPITGNNFIYIYCLWVTGGLKGSGYGKSLIEYCLADAKNMGKSGVCMLGAKKQKAWLSDQGFAKKYGFETVDTTNNGYELLALSFDGTKPSFMPNAKAEHIDSDRLTIYYDMQCPYILQRIEQLRQYCDDKGVDAAFIEVDSLQKAKSLPCVFNNFAVFYKGEFQTVNLIDTAAIERILKK
ncbi:MAG: GNAT family N-acetyltransferase [Acutalibacteraceae bacterium]